MASGRMLLKNICFSERQAKLSCDAARLLYRDLLTHLDINGVFPAHPHIIKGAIFPLLNGEEHSVEKIAEYLKEFEKLNLIRIYEYDGKQYLWYINFVEKQPGLWRDNEAPEYPIIPEIAEIINEQWKKKQKKSKKKEKNISSEENKINIISEFEEHWQKLHKEKFGNYISINKWQELELIKNIKLHGINKMNQAIEIFYKEFVDEYISPQNFLKEINYCISKTKKEKEINNED